MREVLRLSKLYAPTLKEVPADAEIASHRLLLRAGMIRKTASGVYTFLPLGQRVLAKIGNIIREEMNEIGAQEIFMPALQPAEMWYESGRWDDYGPELMRLNDRHERGFCLGPTHEELVTSLVRSELRSYKQLPVSLYQVQAKFRDEVRPRFGLLRCREFIMKDAYSFHPDQESLQETYDRMAEAYGRYCDRLELRWRAVDADSGQIGGKTSCEFMALADAGEAELVYCDCGYAANTEAAEGAARPTEYAGSDPHLPALEKLETPGAHTIEDLAHFLGIEQSATVKALAGKSDSGQITVFFVPGSHELNELKAAQVIGGFTLLSDEEMETSGLVKGFMGPLGLPQGVQSIADQSLQKIGRWVVGANDEGYHYVGAKRDADFTIDRYADIILVQEEDGCPHCGALLKGARGIEVAQVFQLGDKYSKAMNAVYSAEDGSDRHFIMGCYGVGVSRSLAAVVEQHSDERGIVWPFSIAPAHVCVIPLTVGDETVQPMAERIAADVARAGIEVVIDDRDERAGIKFADAELIGWPIQIIVGKRGLEEGKVELKRRRGLEKRDIALETLDELFSMERRTRRNRGSRRGFVDALFSDENR